MAQEAPPDRDADFLRFHQAEYAAVFGYLLQGGFSRPIADEAVSEAMAELYESWFDVHTSRSGWVRAVAWRVAVREAKKERRGLLNWLRHSRFRWKAEYDSGIAEVEERYGDIVDAVKSLPEHQRKAMTLLMQEYTVKEIAAITNVSERVVQDRVKRARDKLRPMLAPGEES
jgi:RNA polymerase sigma factor (sigma-70 family)